MRDPIGEKEGAYERLVVEITFDVVDWLCAIGPQPTGRSVRRWLWVMELTVARVGGSGGIRRQGRNRRGQHGCHQRTGGGRGTAEGTMRRRAGDLAAPQRRRGDSWGDT